MQKSILKHARKRGIGDRIHLPGITSDMGAALSAMDVVLLTSFGEGTPNVALEAQSLGIPVVATDAGGVGESMNPGITGAIVASDNPEVLAASVIKFLDNPDFRLAVETAGPEFINSRFGLARMINETMALYGYQR
jgi:glycosyltransferase involved in cell wall biosynthesis